MADMPKRISKKKAKCAKASKAAAEKRAAEKTPNASSGASHFPSPPPSHLSPLVVHHSPSPPST